MHLTGLVTHSVIVETVLGEETLATEAAQVRIGLWMVNFVMETSIIGTVQHFVAHLANKTLLALLIVRSGVMSLECFPGVKLPMAHLTRIFGVLSWLGLLFLVL